MTVARFPNSISLYDSDCRVVRFAAIVGNETIACAISTEALTDHFENDPQRPAMVFARHRSAIEGIADKLITGRRFEPDGSILIRTADC